MNVLSKAFARKLFRWVEWKRRHGSMGMPLFIKSVSPVGLPTLNVAPATYVFFKKGSSYYGIAAPDTGLANVTGTDPAVTLNSCISNISTATNAFGAIFIRDNTYTVGAGNYIQWLPGVDLIGETEAGNIWQFAASGTPAQSLMYCGTFGTATSAPTAIGITNQKLINFTFKDNNQSILVTATHNNTTNASGQAVVNVTGVTGTFIVGQRVRIGANQAAPTGSTTPPAGQPYEQASVVSNTSIAAGTGTITLNHNLQVALPSTDTVITVNAGTLVDLSNVTAGSIKNWFGNITISMHGGKGAYGLDVSGHGESTLFKVRTNAILETRIGLDLGNNNFDMFDCHFGGGIDGGASGEINIFGGAIDDSIALSVAGGGNRAAWNLFGVNWNPLVGSSVPFAVFVNNDRNGNSPFNLNVIGGKITTTVGTQTNDTTSGQIWMFANGGGTGGGCFMDVTFVNVTFVTASGPIPLFNNIGGAHPYNDTTSQYMAMGLNDTAGATTGVTFPLAQGINFSMSDTKINSGYAFTTYKNIATVDLGLPTLVASSSSLANSALVTNFINYTPPAAAGIYELEVAINVHTAAAVNMQVTVTFKDGGGNAVSKTVPVLLLGTSQTPPVNMNNVAGYFYTGIILIQIDNSQTAITASTTGTTMTSYDIAASLQRLK